MCYCEGGVPTVYEILKEGEWGSGKFHSTEESFTYLFPLLIQLIVVNLELDLLLFYCTRTVFILYAIFKIFALTFPLFDSRSMTVQFSWSLLRCGHF